MAGRYKAYPEYKGSGVENLPSVPNHWETKKFRYLFEFGRGLGITKANLVDEGVACVSYGEIHSRYGFEVSPQKHSLKCVSEDYLKSSPSALLALGDCVFADTSEDIEGSGNFTQAISNEPLFAGYHTIIARPRGDNHKRYIAYMLDSPECRTQIRLAVKGVKVFSITQEILKNTTLWLPPRKEQKQIARFLDHETGKIDRLIAKQQALIALLKEKRQAVISHAVTKGISAVASAKEGLNPHSSAVASAKEGAKMKDSGIEWLGQVPEHWIICQLKFNTLDMQTGPFGSQLHAEDYIEDGYPLVNPAHIVGGSIIPDLKCTVDAETQKRLKRHELHAGELILARRGELGRCAVVKKEHEGWLCGTGSLRAVLSTKMIPEYAQILICSDGVKVELSLESKGSTMDNLNTETLGKIRLPVPPIKEQQEVLDFVHSASVQYDQIESFAEQQVKLLQERRTALISAAVTGKIDVRDWEPQEKGEE